MSRAETGAEDERPAIGAARLEAMFDGLRREVVLAVPAPDGAEVVLRGARRRRRRAGAAVGAGVLGAAALWSGLSVVPSSGGHGVAAPAPVLKPGPTEDVTLTGPKTLPSPSSVMSSTEYAATAASASAGTGGTAGTAETWAAPLGAAEPEARALALDVSRLPSVLGGYGPWTVLPVPSTSAGTTPGATSGLTSSPTPGASSGASSGATPGTTQGPGRVPLPADAAVDGCVPVLVRTAGAAQVWVETYENGGTAQATARQYVLRFGSAGEAEGAGARLLAGGECVLPGAGWAIEQHLEGGVALGVWQPLPFAEEAAVHVRGSMVAVLTVRRGGPGVAPTAGLSDPFRAAMAEFLALGEPGAGQPTR
ncbi:hypothetical protein ACIQBJ_19275 [Kitasatospora sp. NPDC088391]|uniref:hypothetical protein n=1 Tax=Kitasatospora sp. NPDC088391 TaxID=3364074 RepID=UPI0037F9B09B